MVRITIPKTITEDQESDLQNALVGRFLGIRTPIELIQIWIWERWSTKGPISLIAFPK